MCHKIKIVLFIKNEKRDLIFLILLGISFIAYGFMNRDWGNARNLSTAIDSRIPLVPRSIFVYHLWAPTLFLILAYLFFYQRSAYRAMLLSIFVSAILAFTTFFFFTSTVKRLEIVPTDLATRLLQLTYRIDPPFACFPSFHVLTLSIGSYFFLKSARTFPHKLLLMLWTSLICLSTLFTKQHVILDLLGGLIYTCPSVIIGKSLEAYRARRLTFKKE